MSDTPRRIQRKRTRGWRMPENTVSVTRPSLDGNPFPANIHGQDGAVDLYELWITGRMSLDEMRRHEPTAFIPIAVKSLDRLRELALHRIPALRGRNLACWCRLDERCHADVLLKLANAEPGE